MQGEVKEKMTICVSALQAIGENNVYVTYCTIKYGDHVFYFKQDFSLISPFTQKKPYKYDLTSGTKISILKKKIE